MPLFALYILRSLVLVESDEAAMPQMPIGSGAALQQAPQRPAFHRLN